MRSVLFKTVLTFFLLFFSLYGQTAYDVTKRYSLAMDKMGNQDILDSPGKGLFFDFWGTVNTSIIDMIKQASAISDQTGANAFISGNAGTEQGGNISINTGTPLPRFKFLGTRFYPQLTLKTDIGAILGFQAADITEENLVALTGESASTISALVTSIGRLPTENEVLNTWCSCTSFGSARAPSGTMFHLYNKVKSTLGTTLNFRYRKRINGFIKLYVDTRSDFKLIKSLYDLAGGNIGTDFGANLHSNLTADLRLGYKRKKWSVFYQLGGLDIIPIIQMKDSATFYYGKNNLSRIHGNYKFKFRKAAINTFAGAHQRKDHYTWGDSFYFGGEASTKFWKGRFGLSTRLMLDPEHWNIGLKLKGWIGHLNYLIRLPKVSSADGVSVSSLHSLNLRMFF